MMAMSMLIIADIGGRTCDYLFRFVRVKPEKKNGRRKFLQIYFDLYKVGAPLKQVCQMSSLLNNHIYQYLERSPQLILPASTLQSVRWCSCLVLQHPLHERPVCQYILKHFMPDIWFLFSSQRRRLT